MQQIKSPEPVGSRGAGARPGSIGTTAWRGDRTNAPAHAEGIATGVFDALHENGVLVSIPVFDLSRIAARSIAPRDHEWLGHARALGFEGGDPIKPVALGLRRAVTAPPATAPAALQTLSDGVPVVLRAEQEIELRWGEAEIAPRPYGRILLRAPYITSQASATEHILVGSVHVN